MKAFVPSFKTSGRVRLLLVMAAWLVLLVMPGRAQTPFVGWAVGSPDASGPTILCTTNGVNWFRQGLDQIPTVFLTGVASKGSNVWVVGDVDNGYGSIYYSGDDGITWMRQGDSNSIPAELLLKCWAVDEQNLWVVGYNGTVLHTTNGGGIWTNVSVPGFTEALQSVTAIGTQVAWVGGQPNPGDEFAGLFYTTDGGASWSQQTSGAITNVGHLLGLAAVDAQTVWGTGGAHQDIIVTTNAGATWEQKHRGAENRDGNEICVAPDGGVWTATDSTLFWSHDNGDSWTDHSVADFTMDIDSPDGVNVWAVSQYWAGGIIYYSPDRGASWTQQVVGGVSGLGNISMQRRAGVPAVRIVNVGMDVAKHAVFSFASLSGESYEVQTSTNLLSAWTPQDTLSGTQSNLTWTDFDPLQNRRFYRVNSIQTSPVNLATNDILTVTQTWSGATNYIRTAVVEAPAGDGPYPVVILLHGATGTATNFISDFEYLSQMIRVAPQGYNNFWNVKSEGTLAPDVDFIRELILQLRTYNNVDAGNIVILGWSNGAALLNRLLIELNGALFQQGIKLAGQMNTNQFHDSAFWYDPTGGNAYDTQTQPARGRRILSIVGTADPVVPFEGGIGAVLPYYFLHAENSIHEWAKQMGSTEAQIPDEDGILVDTNVYQYSYLNGDIVMYKIVGSDHHLNTFGEPRDDRTKEIIKEFLNQP